MHEVETKGAGAQFCRLIVRGPARCDAYARIKFPHTELFGHVVVGTTVERVHLAVFGAVGRQNDDGQVATAADASPDLQAVDVRQAEAPAILRATT
ncbi:hypothetical protein OG470_16455 [Micromonospora sp. NBC_00389]